MYFGPEWLHSSMPFPALYLQESTDINLEKNPWRQQMIMQTPLKGSTGESYPGSFLPSGHSSSPKWLTSAKSSRFVPVDRLRPASLNIILCLLPLRLLHYKRLHCLSPEGLRLFLSYIYPPLQVWVMELFASAATSARRSHNTEFSDHFNFEKSRTHSNKR